MCAWIESSPSVILSLVRCDHRSFVPRLAGNLCGGGIIYSRRGTRHVSHKLRVVCCSLLYVRTWMHFADWHYWRLWSIDYHQNPRLSISGGLLSRCKQCRSRPTRQDTTDSRQHGRRPVCSQNRSVLPCCLYCSHFVCFELIPTNFIGHHTRTAFGMRLSCVWR